MTPFRNITHLGALAILVLLVPATQSTILIPKPSGPYNTRITTAKLVDKTRLDPFAPNRTHRAIMVTVFYPIREPSDCGPLHTVDYMPLATAQFWDQELVTYGLTNATLENFGMSACRANTTVGPSCHGEEDHPIVIFSPGLGASRQLYSAMAQKVASSGYLVISIDHPYDAYIVEYPDGTLIYAANITTTAQTDLDLATRAQDVSFLLDQLSADETVRGVIPGVECGFNVSQVAMFGHSFGGATTAEAMLSDGRIAGGVNLDGTFHGPVVKLGLDRPFLLFSRPGDGPISSNPNWAETWSHLRGWKLELRLAGLQHDGFMDIPLLTRLLGFSDFNATSALGSVLGTLDGVRGFDVITAYVVAFCDFVLKGSESAILQMPSPLYPEVTLFK